MKQTIDIDSEILYICYYQIEHTSSYAYLVFDEREVGYPDLTIVWDELIRDCSKSKIQRIEDDCS